MGEKISFIDLFGIELEVEDQYAREQLADESAARTEEVAVLEARMDTFTALPAGSTSGDAELMDIRVGADGVTYANAGDAVRANSFKPNLNNDGSIDHFELANGSVAKYNYNGLIDAPNKDGILYGEDITPLMKNGFITLNVGIGNAVNPTPTVRTDYKYIIVPCKTGDKFIYTGRGADSARPWAFTDENYVVERVEWSGATPEGLLLIANNDGYFIANARVANDYALYYYNNLSIVQDEAVGNYNISAAYCYLGYIDCSAGIGNAISLTPTFNTAYRYMCLRCKKGDKFEIYALGSAAARLWAFTDENGVLLEMSDEHIDSQTNGVFATAPADGWFISNARFGSPTDYVRKVIYYKNYSYLATTHADMLEIIGDELENKGVAYRTVEEYVDNKYIDTDEAIGATIDVSNPIDNEAYCYSVVPVETGDIVKVTGTGSTTARLWAFTDTQYKLLSNSAESLVGEDISLTVEQNGYCIINSRKAFVHNVEVIRNGDWVTAIAEQNESKYKEQLRFIMGRNYAIGYANAKDLLNMINYLGNNQNTHPKVLYFENGLFGHKYWMAYTPYPYGSITYENPCVAYSDDGYNWQGIAANPLAEPFDDNTTNYNSDTHLVYNEDTAKLECWYRHFNSTDRIETIYRRTSSDGLTWGNAEAVFTSTGANNKALSPAVIYDAANDKYCMWLVSGSGGFHIEYWESDANAANWTKIRDISLTYEYDNKSYYPWHLDVIKDNGKYVALVMVKDNWSAEHNEEWILFITTSDDNTTYATPTAVMIGNPTGWDTRLYRSSIVNIDGKYRIYYAGRNESTYYAMSITESETLEKFIGIF